MAGLGNGHQEPIDPKILGGGLVGILEQHKRAAERMIGVGQSLDLTGRVPERAGTRHRYTGQVLEQLGPERLNRLEPPLVQPLRVDPVVKHPALDHCPDPQARPEPEPVRWDRAWTQAAELGKQQRPDRLIRTQVGHIVAAVIDRTWTQPRLRAQSRT